MNDIKNLRAYTLDHRKLKTLRGDQSRLDIAKVLGVGETQVANYENAARKPSADRLLQLMIFYGVTATDIVTIKEK